MKLVSSRIGHTTDTHNVLPLPHRVRQRVVPLLQCCLLLVNDPLGVLAHGGRYLDNALEVFVGYQAKEPQEGSVGEDKRELLDDEPEAYNWAQRGASPPHSG